MLLIIYLSYIFLIQPLLEARAEIQKYFRWFFGSNEKFRICFRDSLTFRTCTLGSVRLRSFLFSESIEILKVPKSDFQRQFLMSRFTEHFWKWFLLISLPHNLTDTTARVIKCLKMQRLPQRCVLPVSSPVDFGNW